MSGLSLPVQTPTAPRRSQVDAGTLGRWNAWFFGAFDRYLNFISRHHKRHAFGGIDVGTIVEIGAGVGANFAYLPQGGRVIAVEPNPAMHGRLMERAGEHDLQLELVAAPAEKLPLGDDSIDTVICSLVLCTVADPQAVLAEVRRVLRPGGTFRFVEHVAAHPASPRRWLQAVIARPWSWLFQGCSASRDTETLIDKAGFGEVDFRRHRLRQSVFVPVNSAISGIAVVTRTPGAESGVRPTACGTGLLEPAERLTRAS